MHNLLIRILHGATAALAASGLLANLAAVTLGLVASTVAVTPAWAASGQYNQCNTTTSMGSLTINLTSATLGTSVSGQSGAGVVTCIAAASTYGGYANICFKPTYGSVTNTTNSSYTIPISTFQISGTIVVDGGAASYSLTNFPGASGYYAWSSPAGNFKVWSLAPNTNGGITNYIGTIVIASTATRSTTPPATYTGTISLASMLGPPVMDELAGVCSYMQGNPSYAAQDTITVNVVVPAACSISSTTAVAFGTVTQASVTAGTAAATGAVATNCNSTATPYSIYLGDGNNRQAAGSGLRRMASGANLLPYQLYKDSAHTQVWDATGGTSAKGGSGGVTISTTGTVSTPIYGLIPTGTTLPAPGSYTDTVVVTLTY